MQTVSLIVPGILQGQGNIDVQPMPEHKAIPHAYLGNDYVDRKIIHGMLENPRSNR